MTVASRMRVPYIGETHYEKFLSQQNYRRRPKQINDDDKHVRSKSKFLNERRQEYQKLKKTTYRKSVTGAKVNQWCEEKTVSPKICFRLC